LAQRHNLAIVIAHHNFANREANLALFGTFGQGLPNCGNLGQGSAQRVDQRTSANQSEKREQDREFNRQHRHFLHSLPVDRLVDKSGME